MSGWKHRRYILYTVNYIPIYLKTIYTIYNIYNIYYIYTLYYIYTNYMSSQALKHVVSCSHMFAWMLMCIFVEASCIDWSNLSDNSAIPTATFQSKVLDSGEAVVVVVVVGWVGGWSPCMLHIPASAILVLGCNDMVVITIRSCWCCEATWQEFPFSSLQNWKFLDVSSTKYIKINPTSSKKFPGIFSPWPIPWPACCLDQSPKSRSSAPSDIEYPSGHKTKSWEVKF